MRRLAAVCCGGSTYPVDSPAEPQFRSVVQFMHKRHITRYFSDLKSVPPLYAKLNLSTYLSPWLFRLAK